MNETLRAKLKQGLQEPGLVVAPGDVGALREAILKLCDPVVREPMSRAARAFAVEKFSTQAIAAEFGSLLALSPTSRPTLASPPR